MRATARPWKAHRAKAPLFPGMTASRPLHRPDPQSLVRGRHPRHEVRRSPHLPRHAGVARGAQARHEARGSVPGDDRGLRPDAARARPGAAVRVPGEPRHSGAREPVRDAAAGRARDGRRIDRGAARDRPAARVPQGARSAEGNARRLEVATRVQARTRHGAPHSEVRALARGDAGRRRRRPRPLSPSRPAGRTTPDRSSPGHWSSPEDRRASA